MPHESNHPVELGERLTQLADALFGCVAAAYDAAITPPAAVLDAQRALATWATTLTHPGPPAGRPRPGRRVAVLLLVDLTDPAADPHAVTGAVLTTAGHTGPIPTGPDTTRGRWRIVYATAHPAPATTPFSAVLFGGDRR